MIDPASWSPFHPEVMRDPGAGHRSLLQQCPVHRCQDFEPPFFTLSRFADVEAALRDVDTFSSHYGQGPRFTEPQGMLCDPPQHTYYRRLLQDWFTPKAIAALEPRITALAEQLIDAATADGPAFDLHDDFAFPLPVIIIARLLGVPERDLELFKHFSDIQVAAMGAADPAPFAKDQAAFMAYLQQHLHQRRKLIADGRPVPEDLLSLITNARYPGNEPAPESDMLSVLTQLLVGGNETTTSLITNMVWRLLQQRPLWEAVGGDPQLIPAAVEESLRFDPPVLGLYRNTTRAVVLHETTIPAHSKVYINYAAANRDETVFEHPDVFDPWRARRRHMSFGMGIHMCIGAPMARLEAEIALRVLVRRFPGLQLLGEGERIAPFFLWGRRRLPVRA